MTTASSSLISYYVIKPAPQAVADMGNFLMTQQWFVDPERSFPPQSLGHELRPRGRQDRELRTAGSGSRAWAMKVAPARGWLPP